MTARELLVKLARGTEKFRGQVYPESELALNRLLHTVWGDAEVPTYLRRRVRHIGAAHERLQAQHLAWLAGGVHPLGTRERTAADSARRARSAMVTRRCACLHRSILHAVAEILYS
jgi:hypothetical protein